MAHLGYFRTEFVERRRWLDDHSYSDLVALCQFLPGPQAAVPHQPYGVSKSAGVVALALFAALLFGLLVYARVSPVIVVALAAAAGWLLSSI